MRAEGAGLRGEPGRDPDELVERDVELAALDGAEIGTVYGRAVALLVRWLTEATGATIEPAAKIAGALVNLPSEPVASFDVIRSAC